MVMVSGAIHVAVAVVLVWGPSWMPRRPAMPVYEVQLVSAPVETPRPTPPRPVPPPRVEPKPPPPPPKPAKPKTVKKPTPAPVEPAPAKTKPAPAPTPEAVPEPEPPVRQPEPPAPEPQAKATEPTEPGIQLVTPLMEAVALKYPFYTNALKRKINENWSPPGAGFAQTRATLVVFTIQRDGSVRGTDIEQSSGDAFFDQAAIRSVLRASPFPPLPPGYSEDNMKIFFSFSLDPDRPS
ncbi:MAG: energy transducer TonB [Nitrospirota bacterium]